MVTNNTDAATVSSGAANALSLLLREDPLLIQHGLTSYRGLTNENIDDNITNEAFENNNKSASSTINPDDAAHSYAAALLHDNSTNSSGSSNAGWLTSSGEYRQRATGKCILLFPHLHPLLLLLHHSHYYHTFLQSH